MNRQPPHDLNAEQAALGAMMLSSAAIASVSELATGEDFYRPAHQAIFECILDLNGRGEPADPVMVLAELERRDALRRIEGGAAYLHTLIANVPTAANAGYYAEIVAEKAELRRLIEAGTLAAQLAGQGDVERARAALERATEHHDPTIDPRERLIQQRIHQLGINVEAQRRYDEAQLPQRRPIAERVVKFSELASIPPPKMLISRLMPEQSVGFLNGRSGAFKSFVMTAFAVAIGSGTHVMGHDQFRVASRGRVLYAAAEGSSGVALRILAYAAAHDLKEDPDVILLPGDINIASDRDVEEMYQYAAETGCTHVFVDTFRAAAVGVQENDSTEVGKVISRAIRARDEFGISTLYSDHTGHSGERAVGAEAKWANVDFALMVRMPNGSRAADQQRVLTVEKLKDQETCGEWPLRLRPVADVVDGDGNWSAVIEVGEVATDDPAEDDWQKHPIPDQVRDATGPGSTHVPAMARYMAYHAMGDIKGIGLTRAEVMRGLGKGDASKNGAVRQAWSWLVAGGWIVPVGNAGDTGCHLWDRKRALQVVERGIS